MPAPDARRPAWWPTDSEIELLRAIFAREAEPVAVWRRLVASGELDRLRGDAARLRPQLYEKLVAAGVDGPELQPLRRDYARVRSVNARTRVQAREALERLAARGVDAMLLKGLAFDALAVAGGTRRIGDLDLLVRREQFSIALAALRDGGWRAIDSETPGALDAKHSTCLQREDTAEIDLHWVLAGRLAVRRDSEAVMAPFWQRARRMVYQGVAVSLLDPMDQVLHLVVHGALVESRARARWLADVAFVLDGASAAATADWPHFVVRARSLRLTSQTEAALRCFDHVFPNVVPGFVLDELRASPRSLAERLLWALDSRTARRPLALDLLRTLRSHLSNQRFRPLVVALLLYPSYLIANRYLVSPAQLARHVARRRRELLRREAPGR